MTGLQDSDSSFDVESYLPDIEVEPEQEEAPAPVSNKLELDDALFQATEWRESAGKPNAVGPTTRYGTAKGLMQLLDSTGQEQLQKSIKAGNTPEGTEYNPFDPDLNRRLGKEYLTEQYDAFGDVRLALAAYNHGPGSAEKGTGVRGLQAKYGPTYEDIAAYLPEETKKYVPAILSKREALLGSTQNVEIQKEAAKAPSDVPATPSGFAEALYSVMSKPEFDMLGYEEQLDVLNTVYKGKQWPKETDEIYKQTAGSLWSTALPEERPDFTELVGPPPVVPEGEDAAKYLEQWKKSSIQKLIYDDINPDQFGLNLQNYFDEATKAELDASEYRNRSGAASLVYGAGNFVRDMAKGSLALFTDTAGYGWRLGSGTKEGQEEAKAIEEFPEILGNPTKAYLYETNENGGLILNNDGTPRLRSQTIMEGALEFVGRTIGFGGALLKGATALKAVTGPKTFWATMSAQNALLIGGSSFKSAYEQTGDIDKSYRAAGLAMPAGIVLGFLGEAAILSKSIPPAAKVLTNYDRARIVGTELAKKSGAGALAGAGIDVGQQLAEQSVTGQEFEPRRTAEMAVGGVLIGAMGTAGEHYSSVRKQLKVEGFTKSADFQKNLVEFRDSIEVTRVVEGEARPSEFSKELGIDVIQNKDGTTTLVKKIDEPPKSQDLKGLVDEVKNTLTPDEVVALSKRQGELSSKEFRTKEENAELQKLNGIIASTTRPAYLNNVRALERRLAEQALEEPGSVDVTFDKQSKTWTDNTTGVSNRYLKDAMFPKRRPLTDEPIRGREEVIAETRKRGEAAEVPVQDALSLRELRQRKSELEHELTFLPNEKLDSRIGQSEATQGSAREAQLNSVNKSISALEKKYGRVSDREINNTIESNIAPKDLPLSRSRSLVRRYVSNPNPGRKPGQNYTPLINFKENKKGVTTPKAVIEQAQKALSAINKELKIFQGGKTPQGSLGFIAPTKNYINIGRHNDVMTVLHEAFHGIDRALIGKWDNDSVTPDWSRFPKQVQDAAREMAATYYPANLKSPDLQIQEGLAMFFQHYASGQPYPKEIGNWYHSEFARENPKTYQNLEKLKDLAFDYFDQTPEAAVSSQIVSKKESVKEARREQLAWKNIVDHWVDRSYVFSNIDAATGSKGRVKDFWDANYKRGTAVSESLLQDGRARANGKQYTTWSLKDALAPAKGKYGELEAYMVAQNELANYVNRGLEGGTNVADLQKVVRSAPPEIKKAANNYYQMLDTMHQIVADTSREGRSYISALRNANLKTTGAAHGFYVPFQREGKGSFNPTAGRSGSTRSKVDPISNISESFDVMLTKAFQSQVKQQLVDLASGPHASSIGLYVREVTGMQKRGLEKQYERQVQGDKVELPTSEELVLNAFFSEPLDGVSSANFKTMPYMDGRGVRYFEVDPRIMEAFKDELPDFVNNAFYKFIARPGAQILRPMATTLRPAFQVKNLIRDSVTAWRYINSGETTPGLSGFKDALALAKNMSYNIIDTVLGGKNAQWVKESGLQYSTRAGASEQVRADLSRKFGENFLDFGAKTLNSIERFVSAPEQATRQAALKIEAERLGIKDINETLTREQELDLILAYKRSTTNFAIQGSTARGVNLGIPFFTASINSLSRLKADYNRNPARFAAYGLAMFTTGIYHAIAHSNEEWYKELMPDAKMNTAWFQLNVEGVDKAIGIPLESEGALMWGLGQAIGNKMGTDKELPLEYMEVAKAYVGMNILPLKSIFDVASPFFKELIQQAANKDFFSGRQVVPASLEYKNPQDQYTEMTTELSKAVGDLMDWSPLRIDHVIRATAPAAADALQFMDRALGFKTQKDVQSSNFIINALSRAGTTHHIADRAQTLFTDKLLEARGNSVDETTEEGAVRKKLERMNIDVSNINTVLTSDKFTQEERDALRRKRVQILKEGIELAKTGDLESSKTTSGVTLLAKQIRKDRTKERKDLAAKRKKDSEEGTLRGSSD